MEFGEISGREEDEKRGFLGAVGLLLRCVEASDRNSQRQTRERQAERQTGGEAGRPAEDLCSMLQV